MTLTDQIKQSISTISGLSWQEIIRKSMLDDGGIDCKICQGYFAIELMSIAENCDIEIKNVLPKTNENR